MTDIKQKDKISKEKKDSHKDLDENIHQQRSGEVYSKTDVRDKRETESAAGKEIKKDKYNKDNDKLEEENKEALTKSGEKYDEDNKVG